MTHLKRYGGSNDTKWLSFTFLIIKVMVLKGGNDSNMLYDNKIK